MPQTEERQYLDDVPRELQDLVYEGRRIAAIKLAREKMGWGLKEAKEKVEEVAARLAELSPEAFAAQKRGGCMSVIVFALALGLMAYPLFRRLFE
jgi:ribosomal protein L7/L12